jgi:ANTAR domain/GAF domain
VQGERMEDFQEGAERDALLAPGRLPDAAAEEVVRPVLAAATTIFGLAGAALVLVDAAGELYWAAAAGRLAEELEAAAGALWSGPSRQALATGSWVATEQLRREERWPRLARQPALREVGSLLCVPVELAGGAAGALTVVRRVGAPFSAGEVDAVAAFAGVVAALLRLAAESTLRAQLAEQLEHALGHRVVIEQAKGILMAREGMDAAAAFDRLRRTARASRRRVSEVAEEVIVGGAPADPA